MNRMMSRAAVVAAAAALALAGLAGPAVAGPTGGGHEPPTTSRCNSGNGNGSESTAPSRNCTNGDPGRSFDAGNSGGDEASTGTTNPGGNNDG